MNSPSSDQTPQEPRRRVGTSLVRRLRCCFWFLAIFAASVFLRTRDINADPPDSLSSSRSIYNDGGAYSLNARHRLLFGSWIAPGDNCMAQTPGYTFSAYAAFRLLGISKRSLRCLSIAGSLTAVLLLMLACSSAWGVRRALFASLLLGTGYLSVMYGRLELIEGYLLGLATAGMLSSWIARRQVDRSDCAVWWAATSAVLLTLSIFVKPTAGLLLIASFVYLFLPPPPSERKNGRWLLPAAAFAGSLLVCGLLYCVLFFIPNRSQIMVFREAFQQNGALLLDSRVPVVCFQVLTACGMWGPMSIALIFLIASGVSRAREDRSGLAMLLSVWLMSGLLYLAPQTYRPNRYTVLFLPAAAGLAAIGASNLARQKTFHLGGLLAWTAYLWYAFRLHLQYPPDRMLSVDGGIAALAILCGLFAKFGRRSSLLQISSGRAAVAALTVAALVLEWAPFVTWSRQQTLDQVSGRICNILRGDPSAGDNWVETIALAHRWPAYKIDWLPMPEKKLRELGVRYLVYDRGETRMEELYGSLIHRSEPMGDFQVGHYWITVRRLKWGEEAGNAGHRLPTAPAVNQRSTYTRTRWIP